MVRGCPSATTLCGVPREVCITHLCDSEAPSEVLCHSIVLGDNRRKVIGWSGLDSTDD
jgi:hypothetical protein